MDYRDVPAINYVLDGIAEEQDKFEPGGPYAVGAVTYEPDTERIRGGFVLMLVTREGRVTFTRPMERKRARKALQLAAEMVTEERYDQKSGQYVPLLDPANIKPKRAGLSPRTRWEVLERDGRRCRYCGTNAPDTVLHVDHVKSKKDGGTDDLTNLVTACADCNLGKGSRSA